MYKLMFVVVVAVLVTASDGSCTGGPPTSFVNVPGSAPLLTTSSYTPQKNGKLSAPTTR